MTFFWKLNQLIPDWLPQAIIHSFLCIINCRNVSFPEIICMGISFLCLLFRSFIKCWLWCFYLFSLHKNSRSRCLPDKRLPEEILFLAVLGLEDYLLFAHHLREAFNSNLGIHSDLLGNMYTLIFGYLISSY